jgi:restriction system protein
MLEQIFKVIIGVFIFFYLTTVTIGALFDLDSRSSGLIALVVVITLIAGFTVLVISNTGKLDAKIKLDNDNHIRQREYVRNEALKYCDVLGKKRMQLRTTDDYGDVDNLAWNKELSKFWNSKIGSIPGELALGFGEDEHIPIEELLEVIDTVASESESKIKSELKFDETIDGIEYEHYVSNLLVKKGWKTRVLQASGDQGVDVLAEKNGKTVAIQCKKYASPVGNKAVQEIVSGKVHYGADLAAVVTNSRYTPSAKKLAKTTCVSLLHHSELNSLNSLVEI